jgi:hypothetical protein
MPDDELLWVDEDEDSGEQPTALPVVKDAWGICWRANGRPYIMKTWDTREEAMDAYRDLLLPFDKTSRWWSLLAVLPCESDPDRPGGRGKTRPRDGSFEEPDDDC